MEIRHADATGESRNFRPVPCYGKGNGRSAEDAEIVSIVRVLPNVLAGEDEMLAECLLKPNMELIAPAGASGVVLAAAQPRRGFKAGLSQPTLESTRFSLNGVSNTRAYETRRMVPLGLML
jgi:hypothetical protein